MNNSKENAVKVLGEPDRALEKAGLYQYSYMLKNNGDNEIHLVMWSKDGKQMGPVTIETVANNEKMSNEDSAKYKDMDSKKDGKRSEPKNEDEAVEQFMEAYVDKLVDYYNGDNEDVLSIVESGSKAEKQIKENKKIGDFQNQESFDVRLIKYTYVNNEYDVTIERDYAHDKSKGKQTSTITYKMKKIGDNKYEIIDFTEK